MSASQIREQLQATLGNAYTIERELGGGGMSRVFVALETALGRKVVVKVLPPELLAGVNVERFNREILLAAKLQHPHIVPVLSAGETQGLPFYTMPYVEGESLRARLARAAASGPMPVSEAVSILRDVARALAFAHDRGIVHRDIKPDNVLISGVSATVTDFGIAKAFSASRTQAQGETLTMVGTSIGTPAYMSPEQAAGDPTADHRADIYSFGCMAYELLAGQPPFTDKAPRKLLASHMSEKPRPITELRADTPPALADMIMRCLAKEADDRPQSAAAVAQVLENVTSSGHGEAMPAVLLGGRGMFAKALAIYAAAFIAVAILAKAAIVGIGLPDWVFPGALIVMALGFPVILWTGYVHRVARRAFTVTPTFTPGGTPSTTPSTTAHGTIATMALRAAPRMSWYRTAKGGAYAFGVFILMIAAFMAMRAFGIGPFGSLIASGRIGAKERLLLADFRVTNGDTTLGRVVSDAVRAGLNGTSAFTLVTPAQAVAALRRMQREPGAKIDSAVAREIAAREGIKAVVDGDVTGVGNGYVVAIHLIRADSGTEIASFRETGDGPRGLIDAADKLARALRSRAGESLRSVNATPPLIQATTASLDALRKYSESTRLNLVGDRRSIALAREAVAIDPTFASAWSGLAATLSNYGAMQSAIDTAITEAFKHSAKLSTVERAKIEGRYYGMGPGRDRAKSIAAYEPIIKDDDNGSTRVNLGEQLRTRREYAKAESLNAEAIRLNPAAGTSRGNFVELLLNQGKVAEAAAAAKELREVAPSYGRGSQVFVRFAQGDTVALRTMADTARNDPTAAPGARPYTTLIDRILPLQAGRWREYARARAQVAAPRLAKLADDEVYDADLEATVKGPSTTLATQLDAAIARIPFRELPMVDRPYLSSAEALARFGNAEKARAMLARYRSEMTDTALSRQQAPQLHHALAELAMAEKKPMDALTEFRRADTTYDRLPSSECAACVWYDIGRAFDAAGKADSAAAAFERYLSTPFWLKAIPDLDPSRVPAIRERLGQLYESLGKTDKAAENYRTFAELWKNADPELQPRVAAARERLKKLTPTEGRKP